MRFLLFDRVTHLEPGRRIQGVKCVSLTEEYLRGPYGEPPRVPGSLLIEAQVQLLAWCAIEKHDFATSVVLSVLEDAEITTDLRPGHRVDLHGELLGTNPRGSMGRAWADVDGERIASIGRVLYAHVPCPDPHVMKARFRMAGGPT